MSSQSHENIDRLDKALESIEETASKLTEMKQIITETKSNLGLLKNEKLQLENEKNKLENEKQQLEQEKQILEDETKKLEKSRQKLEDETKKLEKEKSERDAKIGALSSEQKKLLNEYESLKVELKKFQVLASEAQNQEFNFEEVQNLLRIYNVLLTDIWGGQYHVRILNILHGDKEMMSKDDIKNALGIGGAFVLRALHELTSAKLVSFDESTGMVKLVRRMFPKQKKDQK